jgi:hypothetical protein
MIGEGELGRQHAEDMLTDRGLMTGDLVVSDDAKKKIADIDDIITTVERGGQLDPDDLEEFKARQEEKKRRIRRAGAVKPPEVEAIDAANRRRVVRENGDWRRAKPGEASEYQLDADGEVVLDAAAVREQEKQEKEQEAAEKAAADLDKKWKELRGIRERRAKEQSTNSKETDLWKYLDEEAGRVKREIEALEAPPAAGGVAKPPVPYDDPKWRGEEPLAEMPIDEQGNILPAPEVAVVGEGDKKVAKLPAEQAERDWQPDSLEGPEPYTGRAFTRHPNRRAEVRPEHGVQPPAIQRPTGPPPKSAKEIAAEGRAEKAATTAANRKAKKAEQDELRIARAQGQSAGRRGRMGAAQRTAAQSARRVSASGRWVWTGTEWVPARR